MRAVVITKVLPQTPGKCTIAECDCCYHFIIDQGICYMAVTCKKYSENTIFVYLTKICKVFRCEVVRVCGDKCGNISQLIATIEIPYHFIRFGKLRYS